MTPNELLLWLSARKAGSWSQFRGAVAHLDLASSTPEPEEDAGQHLHQRVRFNLERLGHIEFGAEESGEGWRVVPPTLALFHYDGRATGILCGARALPLLERIERAANELAFERVPHPDCPDVLRIHAPNSQILIDLAQQEGISCQADTPTVLLSHLPSVDSIKGWNRAPMPVAGNDWDVEQFVVERKTMKWRTITLQEANAPGVQGLFRITRFQRPQYFLREGRETIKLPGPVAKYYTLFRLRRRVLKYDRKERSLTLLAIFRPPLLTERGLILCSGFPPSVSNVRGRPTLTYRDIPEEVAGMTAEVLKQDLI
ncbi:MAG: hypothetical protein JWO19_2265 [Bryobacterales bacterium]|nr:hypothetical protein [Bryobacterales bacterium]